MTDQSPRKKGNYIGAPAVFRLEQACRIVNEAFGEGYGCYLVGSALERPSWRDVDVVLILPDAEFGALFPAVVGNHWEHDSRWLLMTIAISEWLSKETGLPVDFKFQPQARANELHDGPRHALGLGMASVPA